MDFDGQPEGAAELVASTVDEGEVFSLDVDSVAVEEGRAEFGLGVANADWSDYVLPELFVFFLEGGDQVHYRDRYRIIIVAD